MPGTMQNSNEKWKTKNLSKTSRKVEMGEVLGVKNGDSSNRSIIFRLSAGFPWKWTRHVQIINHLFHVMSQSMDDVSDTCIISPVNPRE